MVYVGIDIAKRVHVCAVLDATNTVVVKPFKFRNDESGFKKVLRHLETLGLDPSDILIGMEATGSLFENLYRYLKALDYPVVLLNPYQTAKFREMDTMKRVKNDNIDAIMIAALLKSGRFSKGYVSEEQLHSLRELYRHKESLADRIKALKRNTQTILTVVFPELETVIKDPFTLSGMALLEKYPTAKHYAFASPQRILKTFRGIQGNTFTLEKAQHLLDTARVSVYSGVAQEAHALHIRMNLKQIRMLQGMLDETLEAMKALFRESAPLKEEEQEVITDIIDNLRTIPGVADKTILTLLAECGNLDRFHSAKALIGYLGLYPTLEESGEKSKSGRLAKRGAKRAKRAIYLAAVAAIKHNEQMRTIYLKYRSRGKAKKEALIIVARRLITIIYAIYTRNEPYDPVRVFTAKPNA
jgi:transposase